MEEKQFDDLLVDLQDTKVNDKGLWSSIINDVYHFNFTDMN